jgi:hypothetical protein
MVYRHVWLAVESVGGFAAEAASFRLHGVWLFELVDRFNGVVRQTESVFQRASQPQRIL